MTALNNVAPQETLTGRSHEDSVETRTPAGAAPISYSPPLERVCSCCGAKSVGPCPMFYCRSNQP